MIRSWIFQLFYYALQLPFSIGFLIVVIFKMIVTGIRLVLNFIKTVILFIVYLITSTITAITRSAVWVVKFIWATIEGVGRFFTQVIQRITHFRLSSPSGSAIGLSFIALFTGLVTTLTVITWLYIQQISHPQTFSDLAYPQPITVYDQNKIPLYELYTEPVVELQSGDTTSLIATVLTDGSQTETVTSSIDWRYLADSIRALVSGSTLPQPDTISHGLARKFRKAEPETIIQLAEETLVAIKLETTYSVEKLAQLYLAIAPIGQAVGIENAARLYFGVPAEKLNSAQAIYLVSVLEETEVGSPFVDAVELKKTYTSKIERLRLKHIITDEQAQTLAQLPPSQPQATRIRAANAAQFIHKELSVGQLALEHGLAVHSSIDLALQNQLQQTVIETTEISEREVPQISILVTDPTTGEVKAFTGPMLEKNIFEEVISIAQNYQHNSLTAARFHSIISVRDAAGTPVPLSSQAQIQTLTPVAWASSNISATFTESAAITVWVDPELTKVQPTILNDVMDSVANYLLQQQEQKDDFI